MSLYASYDYTVNILGTAQQSTTQPPITPSTVAPARLIGNLRVVSRRIDRMFPSSTPPLLPKFEPTIATRKQRITTDRVNSLDNTLLLNDSLLSLTGLTVGNQTLTPGTQVEGYPDPNNPPFAALRIIDSNLWWYYYCSNVPYAPLFASITGVWGFNRSYSTAFVNVDALAAAITTSSATTFTVADVDGTDQYGLTPRFSIGNLIQVDSEWMEVTGVTTGTNTLTVIRGVNGSTAATHAINTSVAVWQVDEVIQRATARQAGLLYARFGAYTTTEIVGMGTEIKFPPDLLQEVYAMLNEYSYY